MKKGWWFLLFADLLTFGTIAQENKRWLLGSGITYCSYINSPGLNVNVTYEILDNFHVGPDFSALLTREVEEDGITVKRKELEYNFNSQYIIHVSERAGLYPLIGLHWSKVTIHPEGQTPDKKWITGLNVGGGLEIRTMQIRLFFESKWVSNLNKYDFTTGLLFPL